MMRALSFVAFCFLLHLGTAGEAWGESEFVRTQFEKIMSRLEGERGRALSRADEGQCAEHYAEMFDDGLLSVSVFFGALDTPSGHFLDISSARAITEFLTSPCRASFGACGFEREPGKEVVLAKRIERGLVRIRVAHSSIAERMDERDALREQHARAAVVENEFRSSLGRDDIVVYAGHARFGTGPGFSTVPTFSSAWVSTYILQPPIVSFAEHLASSEKTPTILALLGCNTERYYGRTLRAAAPNSSLLLTTGYSFNDALVVETVNLLDRILRGRCYQPTLDERRPAGAIPQYVLHPPGPGGGSGAFMGKFSLRALVLVLLALPFVVFACGRFSSSSPLLVVDGYRKELALLILLSLLVFTLSDLVPFLDGPIERQAIPTLLICAGVFHALRFLERPRELLHSLLANIRSAALPMAVLVLVILVADFHTGWELRSVALVGARVALFVFFCLALLPLALIASEILMHPLRSDGDAAWPLRIGRTMLTTLCLDLVLLLAILNLNINIWFYKEALAAVLLYSQGAGLLLYFRLNKMTPVVTLQVLTLALVFSEGLHSTFY
jgi:hypothetical protein